MSVNTKVNGELVPSAGLYKVSVPIQSGDIYSEQERQVGVWTDGKPLYQKTFIITPTSASFTVDVSSLNLEKLIDRQATLSRTVSNPSGIQQKDVQYRTETSGYNGYGVVCELINNTIQVGIEGYTVSEITEIRVTLKYTKTTDTAGSGKYVPSGDKAVHYSTEEEVIGTWTNGKPLYRKIFVLSSTVTLSGQAWTNLTGVPNDDIDLVKKMEIHPYDGGMRNYIPVMASVGSSGVLQAYSFRNSNVTMNSGTNIIVEYTKLSDTAS